MQWTFVICVLVSSTIIASPVTNGSKHKRSISFLTSFLLSDLGLLGRTQERCTKAPRRKSVNKVSTLRNRQKKEGVVALPERNRDGKKTTTTRRDQTKSKPKRVRNNEKTSLTNFANDPYQAISQNLGISSTTRTTDAKTTEYLSTTFENTTTEKSTEPSPKIQEFSANILIANKEPRAMTNENLSIDQPIYVTPNAYTMPSTLQFVDPMIGIPRKYLYEQGKGDTVQTFALDKDFNVIVTETNKQIPKPAYLDDRIKDIILSVPPHGRETYPSVVNQQYDDRIEHIISSVAPYVNQFYPSTANQQYNEALIYPNMAFEQQRGNFDLKLPTNYLPEYTGEPIIVMDDASKITKTSTPLQDTEVNKITEENVKEKPRGDIPE